MENILKFLSLHFIFAFMIFRVATFLVLLVFLVVPVLPCPFLLFFLLVLVFVFLVFMFVFMLVFVLLLLLQLHFFPPEKKQINTLPFTFSLLKQVTEQQH